MTKARLDEAAQDSEAFKDSSELAVAIMKYLQDNKHGAQVSINALVITAAYITASVDVDRQVVIKLFEHYVEKLKDSLEVLTKDGIVFVGKGGQA